MKLAVISLSKDTPDENGSIGLLPLFNGMVVDQQIRSAIAAGAEKVVLISPTMNSTVLQYVDNLQRQNFDIEIVRTGQDLVQFASTDDMAIFISDGILPNVELSSIMSEADSELIFVAKDSQQVIDFERIDQNDRWLGIAKLNASRLSEFIDFPQDWDVGSALLRRAVQSDCARLEITEFDLLDGMISNIADRSDVGEYAKNQIKKVDNRQSNFLERFVTWPLVRIILPQIWKAAPVNSYFGWAVLFCVSLALTLALSGFATVFTILFLFLGVLLIYIRKKVQLFSNYKKQREILAVATNLAVIFTLGVVTIQNSQEITLPANLIILALGIGSVGLAHQNIRESKWNLIRPDTTLLLSILLCFSVFDGFMIGLYFTALMAMFHLLLKQSESDDH